MLCFNAILADGLLSLHYVFMLLDRHGFSATVAFHRQEAPPLSPMTPPPGSFPEPQLAQTRTSREVMRKSLDDLSRKDTIQSRVSSFLPSVQ